MLNKLKKTPQKIEAELQEYYQRMYNWLLDKQYVQSQTNYQKFAIVCNIRTGSTMLSSLLSSHPQAVCFFELFHRHLSSVPFSVPGYKRKANDPKIVELRNTDPAEFLRSQIYKPQRKGIKAVGLKLLYPQGRKGNPWWNGAEFDRWWDKVGYEPCWDSAKSDLWRYLKEDTSISIIHLKRENLLRSKISASTAQLTGKWGIGATGGIANTSVKTQMNLDFDECIQDFEAHRRMEDEADQFFINHRKLNLTYEEIVTDFSEASDRVQSFLGLDSIPLKTRTKKQSSRRLSDTISNYEQLKEQFCETRWEYLFDE